MPFSVIECGFLDDSGERKYFEHSELYGEEVEVFIALDDPLRRHLTRATLLGKLFKFENNKVCFLGVFVFLTIMARLECF
jgi:hypothetical protein